MVKLTLRLSVTTIMTQLRAGGSFLYMWHLEQRLSLIFVRGDKNLGDLLLDDVKPECETSSED